MKQFRDELNRDWNVVVNVTQIKKLRDVLNYDLNQIDKPEGQRIFDDPVLMVDALYVLCQEQCRERTVSQESFAEGLVGDSFERALYALLDAVAGFFQPHRRTFLTKRVAKTKQIQDQALTKAVAMIETLTLEELMSSSTPTK